MPSIAGFLSYTQQTVTGYVQPQLPLVQELPRGGAVHVTPSDEGTVLLAHVHTPPLQMADPIQSELNTHEAPTAAVAVSLAHHSSNYY